MEVVTQLWVGQGYRERPLLVLTIMLCGMIPTLDLIFRRMRNPRVWTSYLNSFALILVLLPTGTAALAWSREPVTPIITCRRGNLAHAPSGRLPISIILFSMPIAI